MWGETCFSFICTLPRQLARGRGETCFSFICTLPRQRVAAHSYLSFTRLHQVGKTMERMKQRDGSQNQGSRVAPCDA